MMINQFALNKALLDRLEANTTTPISIGYMSKEREVDKDYLREKLVIADSKGHLGQGSTVQRGFYQVTVLTPKSKGKWYHLNLVTAITLIFPNGVAAGIEFDGQLVSISNVTPSSIYISDIDSSHLSTAITIRYTVIA